MRKPVKPKEFLNPQHRATWEFICKRPDIFVLFHKYTMEHLRGRHPREYSALGIIIEIRYTPDVKREGQMYKINHDHYPYLARIWMATYPEHDGYFVLADVSPQTSARERT